MSDMGKGKSSSQGVKAVRGKMIAVEDRQSHTAYEAEKGWKDITQEDFSEREKELNLWSQDHATCLAKQRENYQSIHTWSRASVL